MNKDSDNNFDDNEIDETQIDIDTTDFEFEEDITEVDHRGLVGCRRFVGERRKFQDPNYSGPSRRMNPDRRKNLRDRRDTRDKDNDE
ncbi:MAG: hypothetical protein QNJ69_02985 [Gammaproteobacteria bacterium]|nr:hypothetical protein [Gammaproteobacteria bacterium]